MQGHGLIRRQRGLGQSGHTGLRCQVEGAGGYLTIRRIELAAREHMHTAQHTSVAMAANHEHLQPGGTISQHQYSG